MQDHRPARLILLSIMCVIALAFAATGTIGDRADAAKKPGGYGGYGGGGGKGYSKKCKKSCKSALKTCLFCRKQDLKEAKSACQGLTKAESRTCKQDAKQRFRALNQDCKNRTGGCSSCCRQSYGGDCQAQFAGTPGHGSSFRRYCSGYGAQKQCRKEKPDCNFSGDTGGGACLPLCEKQRLAALEACAKAGVCDPAEIEARYQECVGACAAAASGPPKRIQSEPISSPPR
jgi:hypothetical protein